MATNTPQDDFHKTGVRMPRDLHAELHEAAAASGRSYNAEIVARLHASFEKTNIERVKELELALAKEQLDKSEERDRAALYASALRVVADRLPADAFQDNPAISNLLNTLDTNRKARVIATLEQMVQDKLQTLANLDHLVATGVIKIDK